MKVDYTREQAEQVLKDLNEHCGVPYIPTESYTDFLKYKFPETYYVGKVLKAENEGMFLVTKRNPRGLEGFGFDYAGRWIENTLSAHLPFASNNQIKDNTLTQATEEEWKEALIKEAKRREYKKGVKVRSFDKDNTYTVTSDELEILKNGTSFWIGFTCIMKNGVWADIVEDEQDLTPEEANEELQKFAKWFGDNFKNLK